MGWASGSELAESIWKHVRKHIPKTCRKKVARAIVDEFEGHDCDTLDEARTLVKDSDLPRYRYDDDDE